MHWINKPGPRTIEIYNNRLTEQAALMFFKLNRQRIGGSYTKVDQSLYRTTQGVISIPLNFLKNYSYCYTLHYKFFKYKVKVKKIDKLN